MMSPSEAELFLQGATFGMEYESGVFDRHIELPEGNTWCTDEVAQHSPCGVGIDPLVEYNAFGGELQVKPADSEEELHTRILSLLDLLQGDRVDTNSSGLHIHIRVPELLERPDVLRHLIEWGQIWEPLFLQEIYDVPPIDFDKIPDASRKYTKWWHDIGQMQKQFMYDRNAVQRMKDCPVDSVPVIVETMHNGQQTWKNEAYTLYEDWRVKRPMFNYGHLAINGTIEFRMFSISADPAILWQMIKFPANYLHMALTADKDPLRIIHGIRFVTTEIVTPETTEYELLLRSRTNGYWNCREDIRSNIVKALIGKHITLADLNYPQFFIDLGFE